MFTFAGLNVAIHQPYTGLYYLAGSAHPIILGNTLQFPGLVSVGWFGCPTVSGSSHHRLATILLVK
jgi:hypothetical protein